MEEEKKTNNVLIAINENLLVVGSRQVKPVQPSPGQFCTQTHTHTHGAGKLD